MARLNSGAGIPTTEDDDEGLDVSYSEDSDDKKSVEDAKAGAEDDEDFFSDEEGLKDINLDENNDEDSEAEFSGSEADEIIPDDPGSDYGDEEQEDDNEYGEEYDQEVEEEQQAQNNKRDKKKGKKDAPTYASYEDFAHLLEEDDKKSKEKKGER